MDMAYSERKFTELVLSVADRLRTDRAGGATKVNKVGQPVTPGCLQ